MTVTVFGITYSLSSAPVFVQHGVRLRTRKYGTSLDSTAPDAVRHYVKEWADVYGIPQ